MELKLTRADLDAMPPALRHQLLAYLERASRPEGRRPAAAETAEELPLERKQAAALLREISFHRLGRPLRALLDRLAYADDAHPPSRHHLAEAVPAAEREKLGRYVATLNRLAAKVAKRHDLRLCRFHRAKSVYTVHPATRRLLRELLPGIERAGEREEPLWE